MENEKIPQNLMKLIFSIALLNFVITIVTQAFFAYGIFRDELYYIACANRLDIGYVDHPPFSIWILAIWKTIFGESLIVIRIVPAIVSSAVVFMIGLFTFRLGGKKTAVIISMLVFMLTPIFLGMSTIYSMNVFDLFFWITSAYIFLRIIQTGNKHLWITLGIVIGLGLMNKTSMFWLCAGIFIGIIFTPLRKELKTRYPYIAALIALIIFFPFIIWNITHDFAHLEFMRNASTGKYGGLTPISFIIDQILVLNPVTILIWLPGIIFYFINREGKRFKAVGFIWLTTFTILLINMHSKGEYIAAAYPILFSGGAVMIERWSENKSWLKYSFIVPVILIEILIVPFARPLLPPEKFLQYQEIMGLKPLVNEGIDTAMPQFYCDMFAWEEMAKKVSEVYLTIPESERKNTIVFCDNYGKAGAIEYYSKQYPLPKVICPHNSYWYWWGEADTSATLIIIGGNLEDHLFSLKEVYQVYFYTTKYAMPYENNLRIFIGRGLKRTLGEIRQSVKIFI